MELNIVGFVDGDIMKYRNVKIKRRDLLASAGALAVSDSVSHLATDGCGNAPQVDNLPAFDTFDNASSATIPTEIAAVQTKGYSIAGVGAAEYRYDASVDEAYVNENPRSAFISSNGRGFKLGEREPDAAMFGALADDGSSSPPDATAALNALAQYYRDHGLDGEANSFGSGLFKLPPGLAFRISGSLHLPWFMWGALNGARLIPIPGTPLRAFDNQAMICLNVDASDRQIKYGGGTTLVPRLENFTLWNNDNPLGIISGNTLVEGLRGIYSKSRHGLRNVTTNRLWGSYVKSGTGGSGGGQYTDGILLEDIIVYAHQDPDNYAIQINAFGDNLTIRNVHFSVEPIGQKGLHVKNCNGGTISAVINGAHLFERCIGLDLTGFHCENGGPVKFRGVGGSLRNSLIYNRSNVPMVEVGAYGDYYVPPPLTIEECHFGYNVPVPHTFVPAGYEPDNSDINITTKAGTINIRNCSRTLVSRGEAAQTTYTAAKVARDGELLGAWENNAAWNARNASIVGYTVHSQMRAQPGPLALNAAILGATANVRWNAPNGTYYWRLFGLVGPIDRMCGRIFPGGELSAAKIRGGNAANFDAPIGSPETTNPAMSAMTMYLIRGERPGSYSHQVFAGLMGIKQFYDAGYCLGNGEQWQAIPGGPISVPSVNNVSEIRLIGNDNVEIVAPAPPAYGTWKVGDRVENSALGQASDPKDKHIVASWRCATAGTPGTWLPERVLEV